MYNNYQNPYNNLQQGNNAAFDPSMMNQYNKMAMDNFRPDYSEKGDDLEPYGIFNPKDTNVRLGFIRKVYLILSVQLLITTMFVLLAFLHAPFSEFQKKNVWLVIVASVVTLITVYALGCYKTLARSVPTNYILLTIFTLGQSYSVSFTASFYDPKTVMIAAILTTAIVIALTLYAIFTTSDFTTMGGILIVLLVGLTVGSIVGIFIKNRIYHTIIAICSAIVFGIYLVFDTQLVIGENSRAYSIDDYIFAAMNLYIDIIQIFLQLLKILGEVQNN